ncbi:rhodanese-like domain-containing protein [Desulforhopalus singaporensis]|uniref:Rhodanese-related sulfurtransferase n=1 Tax=Desulforhopalus singaporensis TaxID=91360 RepID=A0A1H0MQ79_9BACT|nr:rhodanese-like domain-containing protein [Desulforhopalus singaporensis]SDO82562.1 Rhodanese-related sulfurtransferase [Desulforhopalus singaporensis]
MNWNTIFNNNKELTAAQTREIVNSHPAETYQLIDVRQPREYAENHLPGALLIPLNRIEENIDKFENQKKIIVYCRSGNRSNAACQLIRAKNFSQVYNMTGGILSWEGHTARGAEEAGLDYFLQGDFDNALQMAYGLEVTLQQFYLILAERSVVRDQIELLQKMASFEKGHINRLLSEAQRTGVNIATQGQPTLLEGGLTIAHVREAFGAQLDTIESIFQLSMMFEAQAYDLYTRLMRRTDDSQQQEFYYKMAQEEKKHLDRLTTAFDSL